MERPESPHTNNAFQRQEFYFHRDRLGNITEITDFEGAVIQSYVYDAFGNVTIYNKNGNEITPSSANYLETPYAFTGRELDPETGLYFYRARYYDSNTGRFLSEDPIEVNNERLNLYYYVENNPINRIDPNGEVVEEAKQVARRIKDACTSVTKVVDRGVQKVKEGFCKITNKDPKKVQQCKNKASRQDFSKNLENIFDIFKFQTPENPSSGGNKKNE